MEPGTWNFDRMYGVNWACCVTVFICCLISGSSFLNPQSFSILILSTAILDVECF